MLGFLVAITKRETYHQSFPVSQTLKNGVETAISKWLEWNKFLKPIQIFAATEEQHDADSADDNRHHASFFSGGIDSLFTCSQHAPPVQALISIAHASQAPDEISLTMLLAEGIRQFTKT